MPVVRHLPTEEAAQLLELTRELAREELLPHVAAAEAESRFPRDAFRTLGKAGLLGLPYPEAYGGGDQPYEVYLQVVEELAMVWASVAEGVSVHTLACYPLAAYGTDAQRERWLPDMVGGELLGAYCLSEPGSGSDAAALTTRAVRSDGGYVVNGAKAWITHGGEADFYTLMCRTSDDGPRGISTLLVDADTTGVSAGEPERKMGFTASTTAAMHFDDAHIDADRLLGDEGQGFKIALDALDGGRLGIAAVAVGVAQNALDIAIAWARERRQFGRTLIEFQGMSFLLADMATGVEAGRALYLEAARRRDRGEAFGKQAAMAKLFCTDMAMRVTTDAVQVLGGYGYVADYPVERLMREAKALQIVEGTNQVQRMVIGRHLERS